MNTQLSSKEYLLFQMLDVTPSTPSPTLREEKNDLEEALKKSHTELLVLLGCEVLSELPAVLKWLSKNPLREVLLLDESASKLYGFLSDVRAEPFLHHIRCNYKVKLPEAQREAYIEEVAQEYPSDRMDIVSFGEMKKCAPFYEYALRSSASYRFFGMQEEVGYTRLVSNVAKNLPFIVNASPIDTWNPIFSSQTVIVCGAGPSLETQYDLLRDVQGEYPIIAGGSAIALLAKEGICPDLNVAVDPNEVEVERLQVRNRESPFVFSGRLHPEVLATHTGPLVYYGSPSGGTFELDIIEALDIPLADEKLIFYQSTTVASMCLEIACMLGAAHVVLLGFDLAYSGGRRYPKNLPSSFGDISHEHGKSHLMPLQEVNRHGAQVETNVLWKMERDALQKFIAATPHVSFSSMNHDGLPLFGAPFTDTLPANNASYAKSLPKLSSALQLRIPHASSRVEVLLQAFLESLQRVRDTLNVLRRELQSERPRKGLIDVYMHDVQSERAYKAFYQSMLGSIERLIERGVYKFNPLNDKWLYCIEVTDEYINILNNALSLL